MSDQDTASRNDGHPRGDDPNEEIEEGTPVPDPEAEQGDAEDVPDAD